MPVQEAPKLYIYLGERVPQAHFDSFSILISSLFVDLSLGMFIGVFFKF